MTAITVFVGVVLLTIAAPFEMTEPLVRLPRQSIASLEAALLSAFAAWGAAIVLSRRLPQWRTPLTLPWLALVGGRRRRETTREVRLKPGVSRTV